VNDEPSKEDIANLTQTNWGFLTYTAVLRVLRTPCKDTQAKEPDFPAWSQLRLKMFRKLLFSFSVNPTIRLEGKDET